MKDRLMRTPLVEQFPRKPLLRAIKEYRLSRKYDVSENTGYKLLEQHLGITFPFVPKKIERTGKNIDLLRKRYGSFDDRALGHYEPEIDGYFVSSKTEIKTEIHENMHGFMAYFNQYFRKEFPIFRSAAKKPLIYITISEGIATWATAAVLDKMITERKAKGEPTRDLRDMLGDGFLRPSTEADVDYLKDRIWELRSHIFDSPANPEHKYAFDRAAAFATKLGFAFVTAVMDTLTTSGMSTKDALIALITNPPKKLNQFGRPDEYAQQLLAQRA